MATGAPAFTTTTVRGLAAQTATHELVLLAGEVHRLAVVALGLPLVAGADDDDGDVGGRGGGDGAVELVVADRAPGGRP